MTEQERHDCTILRENCALETDAQIERFLEAVAALAESSDPEVLQEMLPSFRDTDAGEVQYELVEACERYPQDVFLTMFLNEAAAFERIAPQWFRLMYQSILNTAAYHHGLSALVQTLRDEQKQFFAGYTSRLAGGNSKYMQIAGELNRIANLDSTLP